jgi:hypothetical protein
LSGSRLRWVSAQFGKIEIRYFLCRFDSSSQ